MNIVQYGVSFCLGVYEPWPDEPWPYEPCHICARFLAESLEALLGLKKVPSPVFAGALS